MFRCLLLLLVLYGLMPAGTVAAGTGGAFAQNNPDVLKYQFARSYITALSYLKDIDDRLSRNTPEKLFAHQKRKMIMATINDLTLDSTDLLVVKNYLLKYLTAPNMLMRKTADMVVVSVSRQIAINRDEKTLWEKWYDLNAAGQATRPKEIQFVKDQYALELRRKAADDNIVQASVLMTKVLQSAKNKGGRGHLLAITAAQRQELLDKLDSFGSSELDWGLRPGQTTLQASIAVIREILEDSIWTSIDEK
ncbi:MAG: hypothetical protein KGJ09_09945 [Candidatus Omnitrophica bacterium]|nr:hypothetical protein [Candidatus Omnitrophota bacterium]MDE2010379.1 hypothetical protein [Candidatus Omnitrophota bacterium]